MKKILTSAAVVAVMASGASATVVDLDFIALAAGNEGGVEGAVFSSGGVDTTITSSADAYLDDLSAGRPAGLGVCSTGLTATLQCVESSDDNVTVGESLTLDFSSTLTGFEFVFHDGDHFAVDETRTLYSCQGPGKMQVFDYLGITNY